MNVETVFGYLILLNLFKAAGKGQVMLSFPEKGIFRIVGPEGVTDVKLEENQSLGDLIFNMHNAGLTKI